MVKRRFYTLSISACLALLVSSYPAHAENSPSNNTNSSPSNNTNSSPSNSPITPVAPCSPSALQQLSGQVSDLPNLVVVDSTLLRGGQPTATGLALLKKAGVRTIINLRTEDNLIAGERSDAKKLGLQFESIPMYTFEQPGEKTFRKFLSIVNNPNNQPVFVHCRMGQDRTGTMVGAYRISHDKWTATRAFDEMYARGFRPGFTGMTRGLFEFARLQGDNSPVPTASFVVSDLKNRYKKFKEQHFNK